MAENKSIITPVKNYFKRNLGILLALLVMMGICTIMSRNFLTGSNLLNVFRQISTNCFIAFGMAFVILTGGIDISVGSVLAFSGTFCAYAMANWGWSAVLSAIVCIVFCILFILFALEDGCVRPLSTNILLSQRDDDTGAAASVINFVHSIIGCLGMVLVMLPWQSNIVCIGVIIIVSLAIAIALWVYMLKKPVRVKGLID